MENSIEILFSQDVLNEFIRKFELGCSVVKLGDFENYVFEVYRNNQPLILRITHSSHRNNDEINAELEWMNFLHHHNVDCPKAFTLSEGHLIEKITASDGTIFYACLFSKVPGSAVKINSPRFDEKLFFAWGKAIGHMHAVTKNYRPSEGKKKRALWNEEELLDIEAYVPEEKEVIENTKALINKLNELPRTRENFGLIHSDVHSGNFFYDGETVHVFDFDDCSYHWFASDIAIPLYYSTLNGFMDNSDAERKAFARRFLASFSKGYEEYNNLPNNWEEHLPLFLMLRDITLYSVLHKKISPKDRDEKLKKLLKLMRSRIIQKEPIVTL